MGTLKTFKYDLNDSNVVRLLLTKISNYISNTDEAYHVLVYKPQYYFSIPSGPITTDSGWYIVLDGKIPIYVGTAKDLNARLNSNSGSIDNFAKNSRSKDCERNFIKKFSGISIISNLRVIVIPISVICSSILLKGDRFEIEKLINIFRSTFNYK